MVFNRKLKSAVKERKTKERLVKKRCNSKNVHVANKVLVSGKRTGSKRHLSITFVEPAGWHHIVTWLAFRVCRKSKEEEGEGKQGVPQRKN